MPYEAKRTAYVVCAEHVEDAIDDALAAWEESPDVHRLSESDVQIQGEWHCDYCGKKPVYAVT